MIKKLLWKEQKKRKEKFHDIRPPRDYHLDLVHLSEPTESQKNCGLRKYFIRIRLAFCIVPEYRHSTQRSFSGPAHFQKETLHVYFNRPDLYPPNNILYFRTNKFLERNLTCLLQSNSSLSPKQYSLFQVEQISRKNKQKTTTTT